MIRIALLACLIATGGVAHAETQVAKDPSAGPSPVASAASSLRSGRGDDQSGPEPDPRAVEAADDANLKSNWPREGITFSGAIGGGLVMGDGVGRGPAVSFRLGHVATRQTVLTLELTGTSLFHQPTGSSVLHNDMASIMAGALVYMASSVWVRGSSGPIVYTVQEPGKSGAPHGGFGGIAGVGFDVFRWRYIALGIEAFGMGGLVASKGFMVASGLCVGFTYY